jgi:hypothetical protein
MVDVTTFLGIFFRVGLLMGATGVWNKVFGASATYALLIKRVRRLYGRGSNIEDEADVGEGQ